MDNVNAAKKTKLALPNVTPPSVNPNKHPAAGACSQFSIPINIISNPKLIDE